MKLLIPFCGEWCGWRALVAMTRDVVFLLAIIFAVVFAWEWVFPLK